MSKEREGERNIASAARIRGAATDWKGFSLRRRNGGLASERGGSGYWAIERGRGHADEAVWVV